MDAPLLLTVGQVADALGLSRSKIYELLAAGELPSLTIGRSRRVPADALAAWVADRLRRSAPGPG